MPETNGEKSTCEMITRMDSSQFALFITFWVVALTIGVVVHILISSGDPTTWGIVKAIYGTLHVEPIDMSNPALAA